MRPELFARLAKTAITSPKEVLKTTQSLITGSPVPVEIEVLEGHTIKGLLPDRVTFRLYVSKDYEPDVKYFLSQYIKPGMTVFDIGAHFGYYTALSSILTGESGKVVAFEPTPSTFNILKENAKKYSNVVIENQAVTDGQSPTIDITDFGLQLSGHNTCKGKKNMRTAFMGSLASSQLHSCQTTSLDEYCQENQLTPNFIKIDVEGLESQVLKGAKQAIKENKPIIIMEAGEDNLRSPGETTNDCLDLIQSHGNYSFLTFNHKTQQLNSLSRQDTFNEWLNILCLPTAS